MTVPAGASAPEAGPGGGKVQVEALAKVLDLTPRRVQQLAKEGVIPKAERGWYPLVPSIHAYIRYWQARATQPDRESGARAAIMASKARLVAATAAKQELEVEAMLERLMPHDVHVRVVDQLLAQVSNQLKSVPARWRAPLEGLEGAVLQAKVDELVQLELSRLQEAALAIDAYRPADAPA